MDGCEHQKQRLLALNDGLRSLFRSANAIPGLTDHRFEEWEKTCAALPRQLDEETLRVAVVGAIKSGKSTFLNSLLKGDFLKRGAGVVTSIVTRVRAGEQLRANLFFKTWAEVNADMQQALVLFPDLNWRSAQELFDIRRAPERSGLRRSLQTLNDEQRITDDARNRNLVLLSSYLKGYDTVSQFLRDEPTVQRCESERFRDHWAYTGDESLSVYLRDIQLEIDSGRLGSNIEIADCQGSDSANPMHLAMVQEYLRIAHLLVYVISSRIGLRQADIKFLSIIKRMGILGNCLFVLNFDFSEHQTPSDLQASVRRVSEDISLLMPGADLFAFSALYNLFVVCGEGLPEREQRRLAIWRSDAELIAFSDRETARFGGVLGAMLNRRRQALLFHNPLERLGAVRAGMANWISINRELLTRGAADARQVAERIRRHQERFAQILGALKSSLDGVVPKLREAAASEVNRFLDSGLGEVMRGLTGFISAARFDPGRYTDTLQTAGFSQALYQLFQDFKQALDAYITEQVNPDVIRFIAAQEAKISEQLEAIVAPYTGLIEDASIEFCGLMEGLGIRIDCRGSGTIAIPSVASLLHNAGVSHLPLASSLNYSARLRTEAVVRRGFYRVVSGFKKLLKKPVRAGEEDSRALQEGLVRIRRETRHSLAFQLKDFQENLKFKYLFVLIEAASARLNQAVGEQLQAYAADFGALAQGVSARQEDKERAGAVLGAMSQECGRLQAEIDRLRHDIASIPAAVV